MTHKFHTIPVVKFSIEDEYEHWREADNPQDFDESVAMLEKLREKNPTTLYTLFAEVDA